MKILVLKTQETASERAAGIVAECLRRTTAPVLGLATGTTMEPVYASIVQQYNDGQLDFSAATTFNLDEYVGLSADHPQSYRQTMRRLLFDHVNLDRARCHLPRGDATDPAAEAERYDAAITSAGGLDLQLLGIGRNGHIGFNEPTSSLGARTRIKTLTQSTREANARFFASLDEVPRYAITMGIGTIMDARHCLLLATGAGKAEAVARMIEGPLGADCPATALQWHRKVTVIVDNDAAAKLSMIDYYQQMHPDGREPALV